MIVNKCVFSHLHTTLQTSFTVFKKHRSDRSFINDIIHNEMQNVLPQTCPSITNCNDSAKLESASVVAKSLHQICCQCHTSRFFVCYVLPQSVSLTCTPLYYMCIQLVNFVDQCMSEDTFHALVVYIHSLPSIRRCSNKLMKMMFLIIS